MNAIVDIQNHGLVTMRSCVNGGVHIIFDLKGFKPHATHAIHIHEFGERRSPTRVRHHRHPEPCHIKRCIYFRHGIQSKNRGRSRFLIHTRHGAIANDRYTTWIVPMNRDFTLVPRNRQEIYLLDEHLGVTYIVYK